MTHGGRHDAAQRINDHHADDLLAIAQAFGGHPDASSAHAEQVGPDGVDLVAETSSGPVRVHVDFAQPVARDSPKELRAAFVELSRRAAAQGHGRARAGRRIEDVEALYATGKAVWDIGRPQPAFLALADRGRLVGRILDAGCGTGEHALMAAARGLDATGIDAAPTPIALAKQKARDQGLTARFLEWNALDLAGLDEPFDTTLDCGLFHVFDDLDRPRYVENLRAVMPVGSHYYMLCISDREAGEWGPHPVSQDLIRASFVDGWTVDSIEPSTIHITVDPGEVQAWLVAATRV
jgi:SAM-dependent methyltransferase